MFQVNVIVPRAGICSEMTEGKKCFSTVGAEFFLAFLLDTKKLLAIILQPVREAEVKFSPQKSAESCENSREMELVPWPDYNFCFP